MAIKRLYKECTYVAGDLVKGIINLPFPLFAEGNLL